MKALLPLLLYAWSLLWIASRHADGYPPGNDSAYYLVTAKGFAEGAPYRDASSPDGREGAVQGPSVFPLVISLYWRFLHPHFLILQVLLALCIAAGPVLAYHWLGRHLPRTLAFPTALAYGAAYPFILMGNAVMTETLFIPLFYAALLLSEGTPGGDGDPRGRRAMAAAVLWVIMARTRVIGWIFLGVFLALQAKRRRWALVGASAAAALAWAGLERWVAAGVPTMAYAEGVTRKYPFLQHPLEAARGLAGNLGENLFAFASAIEAHILLPSLYTLAPMSFGKRLACLAVFLWTCWGLLLAWRNRPALRPWILGIFLSSVPTFFVFETHDSFRYLLPFYPFLMLFFLEPCLRMAEAGTSTSLWRKRLPLLASLVLLASQAAHSYRIDRDSEPIDYPRDFIALHDSLAARPDTAVILFSPDPYYSYLEAGRTAMQFIGRHRPEAMQSAAAGREAWAICGPRNDYFCERMEREGMVFGAPFAAEGPWRARKVERWPGEGL